jgi:hypothetical protein
MLTAIRDIAIVLLALESLVIGVLLAVMVIQLRALVRMLREEIAPILDTANETAETVSRTATFVSRSVVDPVVKVHSYAEGTKEAVRTLLWVGRRLGKRADPDRE